MVPLGFRVMVTLFALLAISSPKRLGEFLRIAKQWGGEREWNTKRGRGREGER